MSFITYGTKIKKLPILSTLFIIVVFIIFMGRQYPSDKNGNKPKDAVKIFISLVKDNRYNEAEKMWYGQSKLIFSADKMNFDHRIPFEKFCSKFKNIDFSTCKFYTRKGKSGFTMVYIDWLENGEEKHYFWELKIIDGEWKMPRGYQW